MAKIGVPTFSGWGFVLIAGVALALIAIIDLGGFDLSALGSSSDGSTGCQLAVSIDQLNVRAGPSQDAQLIRVLTRGDRVDGTRIQTNFYRQLEDGTWAVSEFLTPEPGSNCG